MDRVRSRVALSLGAFDESGEWKYGKKVLGALDALALKRAKPEELLHDVALLRELEKELACGTDRNVCDLPDDDKDELRVCLREQLQQLKTSIQEASLDLPSFDRKKHHDPMPPAPPAHRLA